MMRVADICTVNIAKDFVVRVGTAWGYCVTELSLISSFSRAFLSPFFCWVVVVICQRVCLGRNDAPWQNTHIKNWVGGATTTAFIFFFFLFFFIRFSFYSES
jgi:hypothetical protein